jgi:hypothetical protein
LYGVERQAHENITIEVDQFYLVSGGRYVLLIKLLLTPFARSGKGLEITRQTLPNKN